MNRSFRPGRRRSLCALLALPAFMAACEPSNDVQPGPPVLQTVALVQAGGGAIQISGATPSCASGPVDGKPCSPGMDSVCRETDTSWCSCAPDPNDMTMTMGSWDCTPVPIIGVVAVFDRLLDTAPFDAVFPDGSSNAVTASSSASAPQFGMISDYASTGTPTGITPLLGYYYYANFRDRGPSLFSQPVPAFPSGATVTVSVQSTMVRAKDGTTPFTGEGFLMSGVIGFTMPAFTAVILPPDDANPARASFTNLVGEDVLPHITVKADGVDITATVGMAVNGATVAVTPTGSWPAGATIAISVDGTAQNLLGQPIDMPATGSFQAM
jgi:hypothetical protein